MKYVSTFVVFRGPPRGVRRSICPNVGKAKIEPTTKAKKIVGDSIGSVMLQKRVHGPAPSTSAASWISSGTAWSPADIRMKLKPRLCQIVITATAVNATDGMKLRITGRLMSMIGSGFWRIEGSVWMPCSNPTWGLRSVPKITDATAIDVATVDEKNAR